MEAHDVGLGEQRGLVDTLRARLGGTDPTLVRRLRTPIGIHQDPWRTEAPAQDRQTSGRPTLPPGEKLEVVPVRLSPAQKAKLQRIGVQRLRDWLDRVRE